MMNEVYACDCNKHTVKNKMLPINLITTHILNNHNGLEFACTGYLSLCFSPGNSYECMPLTTYFYVRNKRLLVCVALTYHYIYNISICISLLIV